MLLIFYCFNIKADLEFFSPMCEMDVNTKDICQHMFKMTSQAALSKCFKAMTYHYSFENLIIMMVLKSTTQFQKHTLTMDVLLISTVVISDTGFLLS